MPRKAIFKENQRTSLIFYVTKSVKKSLRKEAKKQKISSGEFLRRIVLKEIGECEEKRRKIKGQLEIPNEIFGEACHE